MTELCMEIRAVDPDERTITGVAAPYDEVTYMTRDPSGERITRGAFGKSIRQRETRIPLCVNHDHSHAVGMSRSWLDDGSGLTGVFAVRPGARGDEVLDDVRSGYLPALSVGFSSLVRTRGADGVVEVREAKLHEVSLVLIPAYEGAQLIGVRASVTVADMLAPFANPPAVDLTPFAAPWQ
jgi:HK97 family phage prohead protease